MSAVAGVGLGLANNDTAVAVTSAASGRGEAYDACEVRGAGLGVRRFLFGVGSERVDDERCPGCAVAVGGSQRARFGLVCAADGA